MRSTDAPTVLARDRRDLVKLSNEYARVVGPEPRVRKRLALRLCAAITHHVRIVEELCLPRVRPTNDLCPAATEVAVDRHEHVRQLAAWAENAAADEPDFDANMQTLLRALSAYLAWEEIEIVPSMVASDADLETLGAHITARSRELRAADAIRRPALPTAGGTRA